MKSGSDAVNWVVVLMAASSLLSMICLFQVDNIVRGDLYSLSPQFNTDWATYSTLTKAVFLLGWMNIIAAIWVQLHNVHFNRKEVEQIVSEVENEVMKTEVGSINADDQKDRTLQATIIKPVKQETKETSPPLQAETPQRKEQEQTPVQKTSGQEQTEPQVASVRVEEQKDQTPEQTKPEPDKQETKETSSPPAKTEIPEKSEQEQPKEQVAEHTNEEATEQKEEESKAETKETPILAGVSNEEDPTTG
jgi:FtsZ-interacting cell division protein ZipA